MSLMGRAGLAGGEGARDVGAGRRDASAWGGLRAAGAHLLSRLQPQAQAEAAARGRRRQED